MENEIDDDKSVATMTNASDLAGPLIDGMPDVTEHTGKQASVFDIGGNAFDATRHAVDEQGRPRTNRKGEFVRLGRGRPRKMNEDTERETESEPPVFEGAAVPPDRFKIMAEMYLKSAYAPLMLVLSPDASPDEGEHAALVATLAEWLRAEQATEVSPKWLFVLLATGIVASKFSKPTVRERGKIVLLKVKGFWERLTNRFKHRE